MRAAWKRLEDEEHEPRQELEPRRMYRCWGPASRFEREFGSGETALRLFAFGYPGIAGLWAEDAADGSPGAPWERPRAIQMLGHLATAGVGNSERLLVRLCRADDQEGHLLAEEALANADPAGIHRRLYRELARAGDAPAAEALSFWEDPEAIAILEIKTDWVYHYYHGRTVNPKYALARLTAFADGTWEEMAERAILGESAPLWAHPGWAIRVGLERRPPWFGRVLRERMDKEYAGGQFGFLDDGTCYTSGGIIDEVLLALSELGWPLSPNEQNYLRANGYLGDPRERLDYVLTRLGW
jgi:hypothetical protein